MVVLPVAALWFFGSLGSGGRSLDTLLPGVLSLALVASGLVNVAIATGVRARLRRPEAAWRFAAGRDGLIAAKLVVVAVIALLQVIALVF